MRTILATSLGLLLIPLTAAGAVIKLDDGTAVTGEVFRVEDDYVLIGVPRKAVRSLDGTPLPGPLVAGMPAPAFTAPDLTGAPHTVGEGQGKATVLHFWVHWCPHCRSDAPKVQALYDRYRENPAVRVITVSLDDTQGDVDKFISDHHATYPVIFAAAHAVGPDGIKLPDLYQVSGFPVTFVIDGHGVIRHKFVGSFSESGKDLESLVADMLKAS